MFAPAALLWKHQGGREWLPKGRLSDDTKTPDIAAAFPEQNCEQSGSWPPRTSAKGGG